MSEETPIVVQEADAIYESVRAICHHSETQPAPRVYRVLGNLKGAAGSMLAQALEQLAAGLERSLTEFDVYEDDGRAPAESVAAARLAHARSRRPRGADRRPPLRRTERNRRAGAPDNGWLTHGARLH